MSSTSSALRLDYLSPLPPVRSGIADYSVDLLHALIGSCDLRVVQIPGQEVLPEVRARFDVQAGAIEDDDRVPIYHMGNNPYHEKIYQMALDRPGIVVLHDVFLHHLLMERTLARADIDGYVRALSAEHGWSGAAIAMPPRWSGYGTSGLFALAAHRSLLERQRGVLVHSDWARRYLEQETGLGTPVRTVPMVMPAPELDSGDASAASARREELAIPEDALVLGSFGFQTPIKRTAVAVEALAAPGLERAHLIVGGQVAPELDLEERALRLGVADRVHVTGFLSEQDFRAAILACDLCVNLRYPTAGETSASLLRVLALGRGAIVSDYAQFAELPDQAVLRLPLHPAGMEAEAGDLAARLVELVGDRERLRRLGQRARRWVVRHHDPARSAESFLTAVRELLGAERKRPTSMARNTPTTLTWGRTESRLEVSGWRDWSAGERRRLLVRLRNLSFARWLSADRGPGGVMLQVQLFEDEVDLLSERPWCPLPRDLEPGESWTGELELRRPGGHCRLRIEPHVAGGRGFGSSGGATFEEVLT